MPLSGLETSLIRSLTVEPGSSLDPARSSASTSTTGAALSSGSLTMEALDAFSRRLATQLSTGRFSRPSPGPPRHVTFDFETDDAMLDAIRHGAGISSGFIQTIDLKIQPKKTTMNEIFDSLEAMIRRIVAEEVAKLAAAQPVQVVEPLTPATLGVHLREFAKTLPVELSLILKDAILDQGWFDDAITAQAVAAGDVSSQTDFETKFKRIAEGTEIVFRVVRDAVEGADWFTEYVQDTVIGSDALDDRITKVVSNMSIVA